MIEEHEQYEGHFDELLIGWGGNTNIDQRQRAERLAAMKPTDGRRKRKSTKGRTKQLNVLVTPEMQALVQTLSEALSARDGRKWSQADVVEAAISRFAEADKIGVEA